VVVNQPILNVMWINQMHNNRVTTHTH